MTRRRELLKTGTAAAATAAGAVALPVVAAADASADPDLLRLWGEHVAAEDEYYRICDLRG